MVEVSQAVGEVDWLLLQRCGAPQGRVSMGSSSDRVAAFAVVGTNVGGKSASSRIAAVASPTAAM